MDEDEAILIERAQAGDEAALVCLYEAHYQAVYNYVYYRVGEMALAEDLTGEVFVRLVAKLDMFRVGKRPLLAWLYTIAGNLVRDHYRRGKRWQWLPWTPKVVGRWWEVIHNDGDSGEMVATLMRRWTEKQLVVAVRELPEQQRLVILLKFVEKRSNAEVGDLLGKTEGAVKSLQHRALARLRKQLVKEVADE
ncbi:MAG TPA: sigma-70 family RNA polymerase sigma factor [Anaerolineae bacterium]|nr:sigma-70 family RNA polymerase sigma factor [Anaerolineae bacterium]